jgi:RHS repeat-associated protein
MFNLNSTEPYYFNNNYLGTPIIITDSGNAAVWRADYEPYGKATVHPSSTVENHFRFPGQYYDAETGLHYNWHRYYDPKTGRYLTPDPIGLEGGINPYVYVQNDPVNRVDPDGLIPLDTIWDIGNVVYDILTANWDDLAYDAASMMIPYVPAGISKAAKLAKSGEAACEVRKYHPRVRTRSLQDPKSHNFPYSFDDEILSTKPVPKKNGYNIYQKEGSMNDKYGVYEIGVTKDGVIDHRFFRPY